MNRNSKNSLKVFLAQGQGKYKHFHNQMKTVFACLYNQPKTMLMVSKETSILRANICRYIAKFRKEDVVFLVRKGICPISKDRAGFYTTNPALFHSNKSLSNPVQHGK